LGALGMTVVDGQIVVDRGGFRLDLFLAVGPGEVVAILGPNGAGKTTALRVLAGLVPLTDGSVRIAGSPMDDPGTGTFVPAHRRSIGVVFQDYLLFPHLTARDNVAFGPRSHGASRADAHSIADRWLARVGLPDLGRRKPRQLSGGQAQRVALARALAVDPALLLLDEPLAALDAAARVDLRAELRRHLDSFPGPALLVSHDPEATAELADRVLHVVSGHES